MASFVEYLTSMHEVIHEMTAEERSEYQMNLGMSSRGKEMSPKGSKSNFHKATDALKRLNIVVYRKVANEKRILE